jgi:hypothetical protein
MDLGLRRAWSEIVTAEDYEAHMAGIGQAQAAAELTTCMIGAASLAPGSRLTIAGAGTGQMFDFLDPALFSSCFLTCSDLNLAFLAHLRRRLSAHGLRAEILEDDFEETALAPYPDLLLATLLLEHIDWRRGVGSIAHLRPCACAIILQENPPGMAAAVTPGRVLPPSLAQAVEIGHPVLVPKDEFIAAMAGNAYTLAEQISRNVADGKRLAGLFFRQRS